MVLVAQLSQNGFDILGREESNTSIVRNANMVRISWVDDQGRLVQLVKNTLANANRGTLLVAEGNFLKPTGDSLRATTVGVLLADNTVPCKTKSVTINGKTYTAKLLPVQLI